MSSSGGGISRRALARIEPTTAGATNAESLLVHSHIDDAGRLDIWTPNVLDIVRLVMDWEAIGLACVCFIICYNLLGICTS